MRQFGEINFESLVKVVRFKIVIKILQFCYPSHIAKFVWPSSDPHNALSLDSVKSGLMT